MGGGWRAAWGLRAAGSGDPRRSVEGGMTQAAVVVRDRSARWRNVGVAFRHRNGGGWNIQLEGGVPDEMLVIRDANGYEPGAQFRLMVTRPAVSGGTDWFEVGRAGRTGSRWVGRGCRGRGGRCSRPWT
ncbi:hypothetical protein GCM10008937_06470 [Deinococcus depolymerans]|uniref:Uncharacterized protein n=1 Tax=Deinococcus depolymerans TaxID=392408 RepID=A0ABN1BP79_9DEIO